jgi:two-component system chemotaxis response regulator CheY
MKVLLVEDSTPLRGIVKQMLTGLGYEEIVEAADGLEAWDHLEESSFDLLLTDWNMPNMSGFELLQLVRQTPSTADMLVVMLTTRNNKQNLCASAKPTPPTTATGNRQDLVWIRGSMSWPIG